MLPTKAEAPSYTEGMITQCFKEWFPIGEPKVPVGRLSLSVNRSKGVLDYYVPHHLYILSDDKIEDGDWCVRDGIVDQCNSKMNSFTLWGKNAKKIIATTNSLKPNRQGVIPQSIISFLPKLDESFIKYYIEQYNKGNIITDVMVEYEHNLDIKQKWDLAKWLLKVSSDNTITIKINKDIYSRDEVIELMEKAIQRGIQLKTDLKVIHKKDHIDKWIEQNL